MQALGMHSVMRLPHYWARGTVQVRDGQQKLHAFSCWGWSDRSAADAERKGRERAQKVAERLLEGRRPDRYLYGDRPLREEVLEQFEDAQGVVHAAITRNSYGCRVLNTAEIVFVDVDLAPPTLGDHIRYGLHRLLGKSIPPPARQRELDAIAKVQSWVNAEPRCGVRVYRTRAGLRHMFTHRQMDPKSEATVRTMVALGADPLYLRLCKEQESFRARLTPKPWRCGVAAPQVRFPWASPQAESRFREWERDYEARTQRYATCELVQEMGNSTVHREIRRVVEIHDRLTKATSGLPLA